VERIDRAVHAAVSAALGGRARGLISGYVFGSIAEGRAHRESDLDVGILLDRRIYPSTADRFEEKLLMIGHLRAALRRDADVVILNDAPPQLARRIMTADHRVFTADVEADHAFLRTVLSRAADLEPFLRRTRRIKLRALAR
jgi:predicted nucleotidyltransferase